MASDLGAAVLRVFVTALFVFVTVSNVFEAVLNAFVEHCVSCNDGVLVASIHCVKAWTPMCVWNRHA
jgi:hypothetical protein